MAKSKDQTVNGPKVAAQILARMSPENKERIMKAISTSHPELAGKIQENLLNFSDIVNITPKSVQVLLTEINERDLILSLKNVEEEISEYLYNNMSASRRKYIMEEVAGLPPVRKKDIEEAKRRILLVLDKLIEEGRIIRRDDNDFWA